MPLIHSKSKKAMGENIKTEMEHGKPQKQAIAIAYSIKRGEGKKMAMGGYAKGGECEHGKMSHCAQGCHMAEGGPALTHEGYESSAAHEHINKPGKNGPMVEQESGYMSHEGNRVKHNAGAEYEDDERLNQHGAEEVGPLGHSGKKEDAPHMAEGGEPMLTDSGYQHEHPDMEDDLVSRIMAQRSYAKGGDVEAEERHVPSDEKGTGSEYAGHKPGSLSPDTKDHKGQDYGDDIVGRGRHHHERRRSAAQVANETMITAAREPMQFDDLVKRDDDLQSADYTGANSGDFKGSEGEDSRRSEVKSMVERIMMARRKQRNPVPA